MSVFLILHCCLFTLLRAQSRLFAHRIPKDWCGLVDTIVAGRSKETVIEKARKELRESLMRSPPSSPRKSFS